MNSSNHPNGEEEELTLPRASLNKMLKELMPRHRIKIDCRELILNCCTEFIHLVSSEANAVCNENKKKTITAEHLLIGMFKLLVTLFYGFNLCCKLYVEGFDK